MNLFMLKQKNIKVGKLGLTHGLNGQQLVKQVEI
jgi:hypothetical protein